MSRWKPFSNSVLQYRIFFYLIRTSVEIFAHAKYWIATDVALDVTYGASRSCTIGTGRMSKAHLTALAP
eukprot:1850465-Karenia_brevis.AAC.1